MPTITLTAADLLAESAERTRIAVAAQVKRDRDDAISQAIADGVAVTDGSRLDGLDGVRFWYDPSDPEFPWLDEEGTEYALYELPWPLVVALDQSAPAWRETTAEKLGAH